MQDRASQQKSAYIRAGAANKTEGVRVIQVGREQHAGSVAVAR